MEVKRKPGRPTIPDAEKRRSLTVRLSPMVRKFLTDADRGASATELIETAVKRAYGVK